MTALNLVMSALSSRVCGTDVSRRASAIIDVTSGLERACLMSSVATKPVDPATMSFMAVRYLGLRSSLKSNLGRNSNNRDSNYEFRVRNESNLLISSR